MYSRTSARLPTTRHRPLTGSPHPRSRSYQPDCVAGGSSSPSTRPTPCTMRSSGRVAVTRGSFWRSDPAAELRGFANGALPASVSLRFSSSKAATGRNTSPRTSSTAGEPVRDRAYRAQVRRDVLAGYPVAPGRCPLQPPVPVHQVDREPVDLELAQERPDVTAAQPLGPGSPCVQFRVGERVVQAEQPLQVGDGGEVGGDRAADLLRRRVRGAQLRVAVLKLPQLAHELVVLGVGDQRRVQHVVAVVVLGDLLGQVRVALPRLRGGLGGQAWPGDLCRARLRRPGPFPARLARAHAAPSSISSGAILPASRQAARTARASGMVRPASPQVGVITTWRASPAAGSPSRRHTRITPAAISRGAGGRAGGVRSVFVSTAPARTPSPASAVSARPS